ncbi:MAG: hypothetical protein EBW15_07740, partial [Actinobacteria bacterium]|nr:hypothetical protein [Actinomycetota bacterium]
MQILRVPPYNLSVTLNVGSASTEYDYTITDMADFSVIEDSVTSSTDSKAVISLSSKYDTEYKIEIDGDEYFIDVIRPYVNPNDHGSTASEVAAYASNEELARAIIDSVCDVEFYYKKKVIQTTGQGLDYLPIWVDAKKVLKVYENNVLLYDADDL